MVDDVRVTQFIALFGGNTAAYGSEQGGCVRRALTPDVYERHLIDAEPIGVYPMLHHEGEWLVRWGCIDLDVRAAHKRRWDYDTSHDAFVAAQNLVTALGVMQIRAWVERTKSNGYHVWVFANDWVPAVHMRRTLLVACSLVDVPPTEVNPKSEGFADPTMIGNYVRLPYRGGLTPTPSRTMVDDHGNAIAFTDFVDRAWADRVGGDHLADRAALWMPEPTTVTATTVAATRIVAEPGTLSRRLNAVVTNGPLKEQDRSGWLFYVARLCADDGLSFHEAVTIVTNCDAVHTRKFCERADGDRQIIRTVERAYR